MSPRHWGRSYAVRAAIGIIVLSLSGSSHAERPAIARSEPNPTAIASRLDELILTSLAKTGASVAPPTSDEDFLRRVTFDLAGTLPAPADVTLFGLDEDPAKREKVIDDLLESPDFARSLARYWREVIFARATEMRARFAQGTFENWIAEEFQANRGWDQIVTSLVTATGDVSEAGQTGLIIAQGADPQELASETARIFLGIQIQCANCHDHPSDQWKRQQFHELAAFFPRIRLQPKRDTMPPSFEVVSLEQGPGAGPGGGNGNGRFLELLREPAKLMRMLDRNGDGLIKREEILRDGMKQGFDRLLSRGDTNKDGALSLEELKGLPIPDNQPGRGAAEHLMPNLENPKDPGTKVDPIFFVNQARPGAGLGDLERRTALAGYLTDPKNPWFAKAFVNRTWSEMLGEGFYTPVDDLGPERAAAQPDVLELLSAEFISRKYEVKWLYRTIANTQAYQRAIRTRDPAQKVPAFATGNPVRLRADQLYDALVKVLGIEDLERKNEGPRGNGYRDQSVRGQFNFLFGFDPSMPQEEVAGTVPQALFLMNNRLINGLLQSRGETRLSRLLRTVPKDDDAVSELYLLVLAREPSPTELTVCTEYIQQVGDRNEAFEDLLWSLVNSSEFQTRR